MQVVRSHKIDKRGRRAARDDSVVAYGGRAIREEEKGTYSKQAIQPPTQLQKVLQALPREASPVAGPMIPISQDFDIVIQQDCKSSHIVQTGLP